MQKRSLVNLRTGVVGGLALASIYSAYTVVLFALHGEAPFRKNETSLGVVIATYYTAGFLGGAVVGLLMRFSKSAFGMLLIGVAAAFVFFFCVASAVDGPFWRWDGEVWFELTALVVFFGIAAPLAVRSTSGR